MWVRRIPSVVDCPLSLGGGGLGIRCMSSRLGGGGLGISCISSRLGAGVTCGGRRPIISGLTEYGRCGFDRFSTFVFFRQ